MYVCMYVLFGSLFLPKQVIVPDIIKIKLRNDLFRVVARANLVVGNKSNFVRSLLRARRSTKLFMFNYGPLLLKWGQVSKICAGQHNVFCSECWTKIESPGQARPVPSTVATSLQHCSNNIQIALLYSLCPLVVLNTEANA